MKIRSLGYAGFAAPDPQAWLSYATDIIGAMPARAVPGESWGMPAVPGQGPASGGSGIGSDGSIYLKLDDWQWRLAVHPSDDKSGLLYIGFELDNAAALSTAVAELQAAGIEARLGSEEQARGRAVTGIAYTQDPMGNCIELFYGITMDRKFCSPQGMSFLTGDMGLGHLNLIAGPLMAAREFYTQLLGFELTDYIRFGEDNSANFFHCNRRHHSIGLLRIGDMVGLHHLMLEVTEVDMVLKCLERAEDAGLAITSTLGRHVNDNVLSFYMRSPSGFEVEIGWDGRLLDDSWSSNEFVEGDIWGHRGLDAITIEENLNAGNQQDEESL
ncbi:glyoxalase [Halieaceae bacterium IMCC14734]|uniref:Glyoxalase n=1 Tax=Candidatus Litorirhabdus singularis TaxID=2518993 RepID=A0ABT3TLF5_9GAMM|nr:VOC family protein [Candidatus Litorirhabdus singularis]MCX2982561.1 glyoxalase [Candidatus Litorirhabdus singularis]